jgi:hypothetical protein
MKRTHQKVVYLKKYLQAKGVLGMGDKKELQRLCSRNDVPIETSKMGIVEG